MLSGCSQIVSGIFERRLFHLYNINESVDLITFLFDIEANEKSYRRHIVDILRIKLFV